MPVLILDKILVQIHPRKLHRYKPERLSGRVWRIRTLAHPRRRRAIHPLGIAKRCPRPPLHLERVQAAVIQEKPEDDGQHRGRAPGPNDDAPDAVDDALAVVLVQGVETALHGLQVVLGVAAQQHPDADELRNGLADGLHQEDGREHGGAGLCAGPLGGDDGAEGVFGADADAHYEAPLPVGGWIG